MKTISGIEFASEHNGTDVFRVIELAYEQGRKDGHNEQLGTNLAQLGTDCISRQDAIGALRNYLVGKNVPCDGTLTARLIENEVINKLPPAQPDLSEYSDKLWQKAYERGKAEAQAEIVRCKDCRFNTYSKKCLNPDSFFLVPADDFYCGYAERRTDEPD